MKRLPLTWLLPLVAPLASAAHSLADLKASCQPRAHDVSVNLSDDPDPTAPDDFEVKWYTTASPDPIVLNVNRSWSPLGVDRFYQLIQDNYYDCAAFFRVVPDFVVQFGIASDPDETDKWDVKFLDDPVLQSNMLSTVSFATSGPNTRTTQIFVNVADNPHLDSMGFSPFATVVSGMDVVLKLFKPTEGSGGIDQGRYETTGNEWILEKYPDIDIILTQPMSTSMESMLSEPFRAAASPIIMIVMAIVLGFSFALTSYVRSRLRARRAATAELATVCPTEKEPTLGASADADEEEEGEEEII